MQRSKVLDVLKFKCVKLLVVEERDTKMFVRFIASLPEKMQRSKVCDVLKFGFLQTPAKLCVINEFIL